MRPAQHDPGPQRRSQLCGGGHFRRRLEGEIHLDHVPSAGRSQHAAERVKGDSFIERYAARFPEDMGGRQGRVATQRHLDGGREPAQAESLIFGIDKGGFRKVHLRGDVLHPAVVAGARQHAHRGRVPREGPIREGVHVK